MRLPFRWSWAPQGTPAAQTQNFRYVQLDALGVGIATAATPYLPVFLTRLGASNIQVGLLTAMPAVTGFALVLFVGRFLQNQRNVVPWLAGSRLAWMMGFALTGLITFFVPQSRLTTTVLLLWAAITIPQTILTISFTVVMNHVAGPARRYDLMSRRWSIIGLTTAVLVAVAGVVLEHIPFPLNYQVVFIALTLGGASSFYFCNKIELPESVPTVRKRGVAPLERIKGYYRLLAGQGDFVRLSLQQFVFSFGSLFALPLFPLYYVRSVNASDAWIGVISTLQTLLALVGYYMWPRTTRRRGSRFVLLATTLGLSLHPALAGITHSVQLIVVYAALAGIFQAGLDLVFFDELLKTVPAEQSATFISLAQMLQYVATFAGPVVGTLLADRIGLGGALLTGAALRLVGFALFALWPGSGRPAPAAASGSAG